VTAAADLDREVKERCDELTPELLPMLLRRMVAREGLTPCERHEQLLFPYVRAQIALGKAKRAYYEYDGPKDHYDHSLEIRNAARARYRAFPCTCWLTHR
jgi:hypothetical protein